MDQETKTKSPEVALFEQQDLEIKARDARILQLEKELEDSKKSTKYHSENWDKVRSEVEGLHQLIDLLPNSPSRKNEDGYSTHSAANRMSAWFVINAHNTQAKNS